MNYSRKDSSSAAQVQHEEYFNGRKQSSVACPCNYSAQYDKCYFSKIKQICKKALKEICREEHKEKYSVFDGGPSLLHRDKSNDHDVRLDDEKSRTRSKNVQTSSSLLISPVQYMRSDDGNFMHSGRTLENESGRGSYRRSRDDKTYRRKSTEQDNRKKYIGSKRIVQEYEDLEKYKRDGDTKKSKKKSQGENVLPKYAKESDDRSARRKAPSSKYTDEPDNRKNAPDSDDQQKYSRDGKDKRSKKKSRDSGTRQNSTRDPNENKYAREEDAKKNSREYARQKSRRESQEIAARQKSADYYDMQNDERHSRSKQAAYGDRIIELDDKCCKIIKTMCDERQRARKEITQRVENPNPCACVCPCVRDADKSARRRKEFDDKKKCCYIKCAIPICKDFGDMNKIQDVFVMEPSTSDSLKTDTPDPRYTVKTGMPKPVQLATPSPTSTTTPVQNPRGGPDSRRKSPPKKPEKTKEKLIRSIVYPDKKPEGKKTPDASTSDGRTPDVKNSDTRTPRGKSQDRKTADGGGKADSGKNSERKKKQNPDSRKTSSTYESDPQRRDRDRDRDRERDRERDRDREDDSKKTPKKPSGKPKKNSSPKQTTSPLTRNTSLEKATRTRRPSSARKSGMSSTRSRSRLDEYKTADYLRVELELKDFMHFHKKPCPEYCPPACCCCKRT